MDFRQISKGIAGGVAGMILGNGQAITLTPEHLAMMPWWAILVAQVIYFAIGFLPVYLAPANKPPAV